eukprot:scaffold3068_cov401-Prasinococcus_capsulatus_cf.AAC.1
MARNQHAYPPPSVYIACNSEASRAEGGSPVRRHGPASGPHGRSTSSAYPSGRQARPCPGRHCTHAPSREASSARSRRNLLPVETQTTGCGCTAVTHLATNPGNVRIMLGDQGQARCTGQPTENEMPLCGPPRGQSALLVPPATPPGLLLPRCTAPGAASLDNVAGGWCTTACCSSAVAEEDAEGGGAEVATWVTRTRRQSRRGRAGTFAREDWRLLLNPLCPARVPAPTILALLHVASSPAPCPARTRA